MFDTQSWGALQFATTTSLIHSSYLCLAVILIKKKNIRVQIANDQHLHFWVGDGHGALNCRNIEDNCTAPSYIRTYLLPQKQPIFIAKYKKSLWLSINFWDMYKLKVFNQHNQLSLPLTHTQKKENASYPRSGLFKICITLEFDHVKQTKGVKTCPSQLQWLWRLWGC